MVARHTHESVVRDWLCFIAAQVAVTSIASGGQNEETARETKRQMEALVDRNILLREAE